jgi:hypothetical protein
MLAADFGMTNFTTNFATSVFLALVFLNARRADLPSQEQPEWIAETES